MPFSIYKPGQGYWTRTLTAVGAGTLVLAGVAALWINILPRFVTENLYYWRAGVCVAVILGFTLLLFYLLNKPKIADFMIAVEAEMKKVNWPSRKEIIGSTVVVIAGTFLLAGLLFVINTFFGFLFTEMRILAPTDPDAALAAASILLFPLS